MKTSGKMGTRDKRIIEDKGRKGRAIEGKRPPLPIPTVPLHTICYVILLYKFIIFRFSVVGEAVQQLWDRGREGLCPLGPYSTGCVPNQIKPQMLTHIFIMKRLSGMRYVEY